MWNPTTKKQMIDAVEELSAMTGIVDPPRKKTYEQARKLRALASNLPESRGDLDLKVARILKEQLEIGAFDEYCSPEEIHLIEEFCHRVFIENGVDEDLEIPWNHNL